MSNDNSSSGQSGPMTKGNEAEVNGSLKDAIESWVTVFERAWVEQPWRDKRVFVGDSGRDLSFDEMVLLLADLTTRSPGIALASVPLVSPHGDVSAPQSVSEVGRA